MEALWSRGSTLKTTGYSLEVHRHSVESPWTYLMLDRYQRSIAEEVRQGNLGRFLLSEVAPVVTLGRRTEEAHLHWSPDRFRSEGIELQPVDRGGLATYHGPGQWVLFWVESVERLTGDPRGVRTVVQMLLEIAKETAASWKVPVEIRNGAELGVWTPQGKIAAVGIHVEKGVVLHGLSLNGYRTSQSFQGFMPCGLESAVDFILKDSKRFDELGTTLQNIAQKKAQDRLGR